MTQTSPQISEQATVWGLSDGRAGMTNQVVGLCERLEAAYGFTWSHKIIEPRRFSKFHPSGLAASPNRLLKNADQLAAPYPKLIIGCGRATIPLLLYFRGQGVKTIYLQDPRIAPSRFDLVIAPSHDPVTGPNVINTLGSIHRITPARIAAHEPTAIAEDIARLPSTRIAVLIGGDNKRLSLTEDRAATIANSLKAVCETNEVGLMITASRRTSAAAQSILKDALKVHGAQSDQCLFWDGTGDNPYFNFLQHAEAVIVTEDSVNMASEAAALGKPIYTLPLDRKRRLGGLIPPKAQLKYDRFHEALIDLGAARPLPRSGALLGQPYPPFDPAKEALPAISALIEQT